MKFTKLILIVSVVFLCTAPDALAQEMSKDQWQKEMNQATTRRNELKTKLDKLNVDITNLKSQSSKLDADLTACENELYGMLGMTREQVDAFDKELTGYENRTEELMRMSDADLLKYKDEINNTSKHVDEMSKNKVARLPRFSNRLSTLRKKVDNLLNTLAKAGIANTYTVGTWAKDRDCLWNIAKKPITYGNAWLWPKIWQGNKDKIRDPDLIKPGWKLNIPPGKELTKEEKTAANSYYRKKAGG